MRVMFFLFLVVFGDVWATELSVKKHILHCIYPPTKNWRVENSFAGLLHAVFDVPDV